MSPASLSPLPNKNHAPETLIQLQQVKVLGGWDYKLLHPLDHSCFAALCGRCVALQPFDLSGEIWSDFCFYHSQMHTNTQISVHPCVQIFTQSLSQNKNASLPFFFVLFLFWLQIFSSPPPSPSSQFISHQSVLTYSQPTGEVSHDTQDADTKISHLIYFGSVYVCQSLFISLLSTHLYTLQSPCCAHRWYRHTAATFAVFANLALLL